MSKIALSSNALGTGTLTIASPNTNTDRTLTLPDLTGTIAVPTTGTWTPVATATSGSITAYSAVGAYTKLGTIVTFVLTVNISNNGTGAGAISITLPISAAQGAVACGRENGVTGAMLQGVIGGSNMTVWTYHNQYPGSTGAAIILNGTYVVAS